MIRDNKYNDFLVYLDDDDTKREIYCKIIKADILVKFELTSGKILTIPYQRVLKIKQRGGSF